MIRLFDGAVNELGGIPWDSNSFAQTSSGLAPRQNSCLSIGIGIGMCSCEMPEELLPEKFLPWRRLPT